MIKTVVESPYRATDAHSVEAHTLYLQFCMADCLRRSEAPMASHEWYPRLLDDDNPKERALGIQAGYEWGECADLIAFYVDLGFSPGMREAQKFYSKTGKPMDTRTINPELLKAILDM